MARAAVFRHPEPISAINVTPFIDVLLVLLIMMILTIPIQSHKLPIDLPGKPGVVEDQQAYKLLIDQQGALSWDGVRIVDGQLPSLLAGVRDNPAGVLQLQTDPETRFERFNSVLGTVKRSGITRLGFVGNERMAI
jgi:biopolymer transport protein ExbD